MTMNRDTEFTFTILDAPQYFGHDPDITPDAFQCVHMLPRPPAPRRFVLALRLIKPERDLKIVSEALHVGFVNADGGKDTVTVVTVAPENVSKRDRVHVPLGVPIRHDRDGVSMFTNQDKVHTPLLRELGLKNDFSLLDAIMLMNLTIVPHSEHLMVMVPHGYKLIVSFETINLRVPKGMEPAARSFVIGETYHGRQWLWQFNEHPVPST